MKYDIGALFKVEDSNIFTNGSIIALVSDIYSGTPLFRLVSGSGIRTIGYCSIYSITSVEIKGLER